MNTTTLQTVTSKDGTRIAYETFGSGPTVVVVPGAMQYRAFDQGLYELANLLSAHFTAVIYDRRGRGDSGDTQPFAVEREIEDIEALIDANGGSAYLCGISSGAALAMEAALSLGDKVKKLVMYEPPYNADTDARQAWASYRQNLQEALGQGRKGDAVGLFMMLVGMPEEQLPMMHQDPSWPLFEGIAPTLEYDAAALGAEADVPLERASRLTTPALVMAGSETYPFMHASATALADVMPNGQYRQLEGQSHEVASSVLAPVLIEFFSA